MTVTSEAGDLVETDPPRIPTGSRALRQAAARKPVLFAEFAGDASHARDRGRFERPVSWAGRSRLELVLARRPAYHRPAEQGLLQSDPARLGAIDGSDRRRAAGRIRRQDQRGDRSDHALRPGREASRTAISPLPTALSARTNGGFDLAYGGNNVGQFHFGERHEYGPVSGWAGICQSCTITATKRISSTASISSPRRPTPSI